MSDFFAIRRSKQYTERLINKSIANGNFINCFSIENSKIDILVESSENNVTIKKIGENLCSHFTPLDNYNGVTATIDGNGIITMSGTATENFTLPIYVNYPAGTYSKALFGAISGVVLRAYDGSVYHDDAIFTTPDPLSMIVIRIAGGTNVDGVIVKPQIEIGANPPSEFIPYTAEKKTVSISDGLGSCYFSANEEINNITTSAGTMEATYNQKSSSPVYISRNDDVVHIISKYNADYDLCVNMQKQGGLDENDEPTLGNQLFDFCRWYLVPNQSEVVSNQIDNATQISINGTDFFGPYTMYAVNNIDGDVPSSTDFTGGNHAYNGDATGSHTARTSQIDLFVDGRKTKKAFAGYVNSIEIIWTNYIQATNTKKADGTGREVLKETHKLYFNGHKWEVQNEIVALEDITIEIYYGLQSKQSWLSTQDPLRYKGSKANRDANPRNTVTNSGDKNCNTMVFKGTNYSTELGIDTRYDLGDFSACIAQNYSAFSSTGKLYFNLINYVGEGSYYPLSNGEMLYFKGYYKFFPTL